MNKQTNNQSYKEKQNSLTGKNTFEKTRRQQQQNIHFYAYNKILFELLIIHIEDMITDICNTHIIY